MGEHREYKAVLLRAVEETHRVSAKDDAEALVLAQALVRWVNRQGALRSHKATLFAIEELCLDGSSRRVPITGDEGPGVVFAGGKLGSLRCGNCDSENLREERKEPVYDGGLPTGLPPATLHHVGDSYILRCKDCGALNTYEGSWGAID